VRGDNSIVKICVLASGSSGNATFVATERTRLLVDAGLSMKETCRRLESIGEDAARLDAILITHEHSDHVAGVARMAKRWKVPVYLTRLTAPVIDWLDGDPRLEPFQAGARFTIGDIDIDSFTIPHDAIDPVGYCLRAQGVKFSIATDLGYITDSIRFHLAGSTLVVLESNHDLEMLKVGPYPWAVKQRVMSRVGHLSNNGACDFIGRDFDGAAATLVLGHLSEHNNHPEIVRLMAREALDERGLDANLVIASQKQPTEVFTF
ncbi:MAG: MBL fold metallo-hydrolase, partial [Bryobacteraceae bacterium]